LLGDFYVPSFDWNSGLPSPNCHFYTKLKGDVIHSATCFLGLSQHNYSDSGSNLLDLVFPNFADLSVDHPDNGLVQPDNFHPPLYNDVQRSKQNCNICYKRFSARNYAVLYNVLFNYDWSSVYNETSVDDAVDILNLAVTQAIDKLKSINILIGFLAN
jgi:hypothetical protein